MENYHKKNFLKSKEDEFNNNQNEIINTITSSIINHNKDGTTSISENILTTVQTNEINIEKSSIIGTKLVEADNNDQRYLKAIKQKGEVAILKDENKLVEIIKLETLNRILRLIGTNLKEFYYDISFGIYSCEEIIELRKSYETKFPGQRNNFNNDYDYFNCYLPHEKQLEKINLSNDIIFDTVQKKINILDNERGFDNIKERKNDNENENKLLNNKKIFGKEDNFKQINKIENNINIINDQDKMKDKTSEKENKKILKDKQKKINNNEDKIKRALVFRNNIEEMQKIRDSKNKDKNENIFVKQNLIKNKKLIKNNNLKKKPIVIKVNDKKFNNRNLTLYTPNKTENRKINVIRNGSTILKSRKFEPTNNQTEIPLKNFKKKMNNRSTTNINNRKMKNNANVLNIRTFRCDHKTVCKNAKSTINDFYQINKERYNSKIWNENYVYNRNNSEVNLKDIDIENIKQTPKCLKCGIIQDINKRKGVYICENCKGLICGRCSKIHYLKNPEHKCHYMNIHEEGFIDKSKSTENLFMNKSKIYNLPEIENENTQKLIRNQIVQKNSGIIFSKNCKICDILLPLDKEQINLVNCEICKGNICNNCLIKHNKEYPDHSFIHLKLILIRDNISYDNYLIPKLHCNICQKQKSDYDNFYSCDKCKIYLCVECKNEHDNKYQEHTIYLIKRIIVNNENNLSNKDNIICRQCATNLISNDTLFRKCDNCKIYLCEPCSKSHLEKYKNHNIIYAIFMENYKLKNDFDENNNNNKIPKENDNLKPISIEQYKPNISETKNYKKDNSIKDELNCNKICIRCNSLINDVKKCNYVYGYLCPSCLFNSSLNNKNPNIFTELNNFSLSKILKENIFNKETNITKQKDVNICNGCKKDLPINKRMIHFCIICNTKFCYNCATIHNNENSDHILILMKNNKSNDDKEIKNIIQYSYTDNA